jgi:hypothetical protein
LHPFLTFDLQSVTIQLTSRTLLSLSHFLPFSIYHTVLTFLFFALFSSM